MASKLKYRLTNDGHTVGLWDDRDEAITFTREYVAEHPEQVIALQLTVYEPTYKRGAVDVMILHGQDLVEFLEDVDLPYTDVEEE